jgi:hypothetical protein
VTHDISATIYCKSDADLQEVEDTLIENINKLYTPKLNFLGRSIFLSDISDVLNGRNADDPDERLEQLISYIKIDPSVSDLIITNKRYYAKLGNLNLTMRHTTRDGYSGRLDIAPNQADATIIT